MLFIPEDDTDYDNIFWVTRSNHVYRTDFANKTVVVDRKKKFEEPNINLSALSNPEIFKCKYQKDYEPQKEESETDRTKWVKILAILTGVGIIISFGIL